ncbi:ParM/StbA family protein [Sporolactobacillus sp. STSJ-5]|uniref:ParM/StbA family protein n=1 Tax=Sporolactobacillus sp. STSJ-5 TaxID=2965076 RepID=UPI002104A874|nr:ParM/StbA family protein [Sporolactobacillus sp. STSJ-5]MCQ2010522.1 ParM/StbA family protein [Sporolactobacillus sp. STSJ-5]
MTNVSIDLGYGWTKALANGDKFFQPSVIGNYRQLMEQQTKQGDLIFTEGTEQYFVGDLALRQSYVRYTSTGEDKTDTWTTGVLLKTVLAKLAPTGTVNIVTGLPVDYYLSQRAGFEKLLDTVNQSGKYQIEIVGQGTVHANPLINRRKIVPQPFGSAMDYLLNADGSVAKMDAARKSILVVDVGYYTLDLLELNAMEIGKNSRSPRNLGVDTAYNLLHTYLLENIGRAPDRFELDKYVLDGNYAGYDIHPLIDKSFKSLAQQIRLEIDNQSEFYDLYLITGGSASLIAGYLNLPNQIVLEDPQFANCRGYAKIGARAWQKTNA